MDGWMNSTGYMRFIGWWIDTNGTRIIRQNAYSETKPKGYLRGSFQG